MTTTNLHTIRLHPSESCVFMVNNFEDVDLCSGKIYLLEVSLHVHPCLLPTSTLLLLFFLFFWNKSETLVSVHVHTIGIIMQHEKQLSFWRKIFKCILCIKCGEFKCFFPNPVKPWTEKGMWHIIWNAFHLPSMESLYVTGCLPLHLPSVEVHMLWGVHMLCAALMLGGVPILMWHIFNCMFGFKPFYFHHLCLCKSVLKIHRGPQHIFLMN